MRDGDDFGCPPEPLLCDPSKVALIAIDNAIDLRERVFILAQTWSETSLFTSDLVCEFNRIAMRNIYACAGIFRNRYSAPEGLNVPNHKFIPRLVEDMCDYANAIRDDPFHRAAYLLWRTNSIHPFYDGNGRVSRALCHLAILPATGDTWSKPLPELIADDEDRYVRGLIAAHKKWTGETFDVSELQAFISELYIDNVKP